MAQTSSPRPDDRRNPAHLEAALDAADAEVTRWEQAVIDAQSWEEAEAAREELTRAELRLQALLDEQDEEGSCEGWPRGK